jgi:hypothetical protein
MIFASGTISKLLPFSAMNATMALERAQKAVETASEIARAGYRPDGLLVKSGQKWSERFEDMRLSEG